MHQRLVPEHPVVKLTVIELAYIRSTEEYVSVVNLVNAGVAARSYEVK